MKIAPSAASPETSFAKKLSLRIILGLVLLMLLLWGPRLGSGLVTASSTGAALQTSGSADGSPGDFHYFRSGQWLADFRTLLAACRYVLEPEPA